MFAIYSEALPEKLSTFSACFGPAPGDEQPGGNPSEGHWWTGCGTHWSSTAGGEGAVGYEAMWAM